LQIGVLAFLDEHIGMDDYGEYCIVGPGRMGRAQAVDGLRALVTEAK